MIPAFDPSYRQVTDMKGTTEIVAGTDMISETSIDQFFKPGTRRALVASIDATFGMARMFALPCRKRGADDRSVPGSTPRRGLAGPLSISRRPFGNQSPGLHDVLPAAGNVPASLRPRPCAVEWSSSGL